MLALVSLFGNVWFARTGVAVLLVGSLVAVRAAWDEVSEARLYGHGQLLAAEKHHQVLLVETRQSATIVREVLRSRNAVLAETLASVRTDLAASRSELVQRNKVLAEQLRMISTMRGDLAAVRIERDDLAEDVAAFIERIDLLEEVVGSDSAEVVNLPRRVRRHERHDSWLTAELPSVAEMVQHDLASPATPVWKQA